MKLEDLRITTGLPWIERVRFMRWRVLWRPPSANSLYLVSEHWTRFMAMASIKRIRRQAMLISVNVETQFRCGNRYAAAYVPWDELVPAKVKA